VLTRFAYLALALFLLALVARLLPGPRTIDDAYITFRYARNLLAGNGFVFNAGERVLGTTTPLFTLLLAAIGAIAGGVAANFPLIALVLSALADGATAVLLFKLGERLGSPQAGLASALIWCIAPYSVTFGIGGLETSFYVLLLVALFHTHLQKSYALAAGLAAAALLTRPDAILLVAAVVAARLFSKPRIAISRKEFFVFALPLLAWGLFAWLYFGSPIPQSVLAKSSAYRIEPFAALVRLLQHYATPFLEHLTFGALAIRVGILLFPFLAVIGARVIYKREPGAWPFVLFPWIYLAVFAIANPLIFRWYLTPPLPFYFLCIFFGVEGILTQIANRLSLPSRLVSPVYLFTCLLLLALLFRGWVLHPAQPPDRPAPGMAWIELEQLYQQAARFLQPEMAAPSEQVTVAAADVGMLGYALPDGRILDLVGLNSKETLSYYPLESAQYSEFIYAVPPKLIADQQPEYVVILEIYGRNGLLHDQFFLEHYRQIKLIPTDIYGSRGLAIYQLLP
jgi:hypothetical protein